MRTPMRFPRVGVALIAAAFLALPAAEASEPVKVLVNHVGYDTFGSKKLVVEVEGGASPVVFSVLDAAGKAVLDGTLHRAGAVDRWKSWQFYAGSFSALDKPGTYRVRVTGPGIDARSEPFEVRPKLLAEVCLSDLVFGVRSQRSAGEFDRADRSVGFCDGRKDRVDVHGGWYDASGDVGKYLSHLGYANFMSPQQAPFVVWAFLEAAELVKNDPSVRLRSVAALLEDEALYGADFLVRMQDPAGYFYLSVVDSWSHDPKQREICAFRMQEGYKLPDYQAGLREGGGVAIAALARAGALKRDGEFSSGRYLAAAEKGFAHLQANNAKYIDDHTENIIDDYCALLAAGELYNATGKASYLEAARARAQSLIARLSRDEKFDGFFRADGEGTRPFFHAVEAGLPLVALARYARLEKDPGRTRAVWEAVARSVAFELTVTGEVTNPFGYARQVVKDAGGDKRSSFFMPHRNETGYWWQGENARLASLAAAAFLASPGLPPDLAAKARAYAVDQIDWILGLNPFDVCMLQGRGRNAVDLLPETPNNPGGVCNGITAGVADEHDIDFLPPPYDADPNNNWRWSEQWLPHEAWLTLALAAQAVAR